MALSSFEHALINDSRPAHEFPLLRRIWLGTHPMPELLTGLGKKVSGWGRQIALKSPVSPKKVEIDLYSATVAELGFKDNATWQQVRDRILNLGYRSCPPEAGPQLRRQYEDQPNGEYLWLVMEPIADADAVLSVFYVFCGNESGAWLSAGDGHPKDILDPSSRVVFSR